MENYYQSGVGVCCEGQNQDDLKEAKEEIRELKKKGEESWKEIMNLMEVKLELEMALTEQQNEVETLKVKLVAASEDKLAEENETNNTVQDLQLKIQDLQWL